MRKHCGVELESQPLGDNGLGAFRKSLNYCSACANSLTFDLMKTNSPETGVFAHRALRLYGSHLEESADKLARHRSGRGQ
jgi:hypothetical protein